MFDAESIGFIVTLVILVGLAALYARFLRDRKGIWLRTALAAVGDAVITTDMQGFVTSINEVAEKLSGWTAKDALKKPSHELLRLVDHDTRVPLENPVARVLESEKTLKLAGNTVLIARDGSERPIESSAVPIRDLRGRLKGVVLIFRDITERYMIEQKLLESEERLKAVTNEVRLGLVMINRDRRYVYANNFYMQMLGISSDVNLLGRKVGEVLPALYERIRPNLDRAFAGERLSYEIKGINKNEKGGNRLYSVTYEPQKRQSLVMHVIIVVLDITHIKPPEISSAAEGEETGTKEPRPF